MFDITDCLCELLKCMDGTGGRTKKNKKKSCGNTDFMYFFHTQLGMFC